MPRRRAVCTRNVLSYPRRSRVNFRCGTSWRTQRRLAAGALRAAVFRLGAALARFAATFGAGRAGAARRGAAARAGFLTTGALWPRWRNGARRRSRRFGRCPDGGSGRARGSHRDRARSRDRTRSRSRPWRIWSLVDQREAHLIPDVVVRPDFGHHDFVIQGQSAGHIHRADRHIQVERHPEAAVGGPLGHGFEVVDRLPGLNLNHAFDPSGPLHRIQYGVRVRRFDPRTDAGILLGTRVDADFELPLVLTRQQADDPVVLELLPDRPNEDRAHLAPPKERTSQNDAILYQRRLRCFGVSPRHHHRYHCHLS